MKKLTAEFYVQVIASKWNTFWYNSFMGHIFLVKEDIERDSYALVDESGWIEKADCVVVDVHSRDFTIQ